MHLGNLRHKTNTARLHRDISLLQQQGDGDGLHWRHPLEAHLRNEALCALQATRGVRRPSHTM